MEVLHNQGTLVIKEPRNQPNDSKTTLEHSDDDPKGVFSFKIRKNTKKPGGASTTTLSRTGF